MTNPNCQENCEHMCMTSAETGLPPDPCETTCQSTCMVAAQNDPGCTSACQLACQVCQSTCESSCERACQDQCQVSCQSCLGACMSGCQVQTQGYDDPINYTPKVLQETQFYGASGVHKGTGNYSETVVDMAIESPGFKINLSRSYNSKDTRNQKLIGKGWTFGFEGTLSVETVTVVRLPDGSSMSFDLSAEGIFTAKDNRATLVKNPDNTYTLKTKDQYQYLFNSAGRLTKMMDRFDNAIDIALDGAGKVTEITAGGNESYVITYNGDGRISKITEQNAIPSEVREVIYTYTGENLTQVTDPMGNSTTYLYDAQGFLVAVKDPSGNTLRAMTYDHSATDLKDKLIQLVDATGNVFSYSYDTASYITTITDRSGRTSRTWFDDANYPIKTEDPDGRFTETVYRLDGTLNKYGEVKSVKDRAGNITQYEYDDHGNLKKVIKPDESTLQYSYDNQNNKILEIDERSIQTQYVYDTEGKKLLQVIKGEAITAYTYYDKTALVPFGGLVKTVTNPEGGVIEYTYDSRGNVLTQKDHVTGAITTFEYNAMDLKTSEISPLGYRREFVYTKNRQLYKEIQKDLNGTIVSTAITVYDAMGRPIKRVAADQYNPALDIGINTYTGDQGTRFEYTSAGFASKEIDKLGQVTLHERDDYGNAIKTTLPNGSQCLFTYDKLNRMLTKSHKQDVAATSVLLESWSYQIVGPNTVTVHTKHLNDIQSAVTTTEFDFAGRPLKVTSPDGSVVSHSYYPDGLIKETIDALGYKTHFKYDSYDNLTQKWTQGEVIDGVAKFRYDKMVYDLNGHLTREIKSPAWVNAFEEPETPYTSGFTTGYTYLANGQLLSILEPQGKFTTHVYNLDGKLTRTTETIDANRDRITQMAYDAKGQVVSRTITVEKGQLIGNSLEDTGPDQLEIKTEYDAMGRIVKEIAADGSVTEHSYDLLGRKTATWEQGIDENGLSALVKEAFTHTWDGKVKTHKDFKGNVTVYDYDSLGNCIKITGPLGDTKQFAYDKAGRLVREAQPAAYEATKAIGEVDHVQYVYDLLGRLLEKRDQFTQRVWQPHTQTYAVSSVTVVSKAYQYNAMGKVTKEMDGEQYLVGKGTVMTYTPAGQVKSMLTAADADKGATATSINQYDALGRKLSEKNALGNILIYSYDADDNLTHTAFKATEGAAEVLLETKGYDYENRLKQVVDANGFVRSYTYTLLGQKQSETLPSDATLPALTLNYQYDRTGQMARSVDSLGREVLITYDHAGRVLTKALQNTDGTERLVHQYRYDLNGNLVKEINPANHAITKAYDALNRLVSESVTVKAPGFSDVVQTTSFTYDLNGNRLTETNWLGNSVQMVYDGKNRLVDKKDPSLNVVERHNYNRADASTESFDANGGKISFSYDANQRLLSTTDAEGLVTTQTYDLLGRVHKKVDGKGQITTHHYDAFGRLTDLTDALGLVTHFTYDLMGNLLVQTEAGGKTTTYQYGARGQVTKRFEHGGLADGIETPSRRTAFFYTADGKLAKETDRKGQDTLYTYDRHNRLLQKVMVGETVSFLYDAAGNVTTINDNTGITVRSFDSLGRLLTETAPLTGMVTYEHDLTTVAGVTLNAGEVATKTIDSKGDAVLRIFDKNGRLSRVVDMIGPMSTVTYLYDPVGNQREVIQSNGVKSVYTYDNNNQVVTLTTYKADGSVFEAFSYSYDSAKNQISKTDRKGLTSYVYDALNRLKEVTEPSGKVTTYTFDAAGNRATEHVVLGEDEKRTTYLYNELNQLLEATTAKVDTIAPGIAITPAGKVFNGTVSVCITTPDPAASLYYTTNGSMPSATNGTLFTEAFNIGATTTLKAVAIDPAGNASEVKTEIYTLDNVAPDLMVSPVGKSFSSTLAVTLSSSDPTASIYYTTNGTAPSAVNGTLYTTALNLTATTTLKAVAIDPVGNASAVTTEVYILDTIAPGIVITPAGRSFNGTLTVTLSSLDPTASIYYTTNGTTPSAVNGTLYTAALNLTATTTVKAIAIDPAGNASSVVTEVYTFDNVAPGIAITPAGKSFNGTLAVTLSSLDPTASIYYTTNGTTPSAVNGTRYTAAFNVGATTTVKAVAIDPAGNASAVATEVYTFDNVAPSVTISPGSRSFGSSFSVTLSSADGTASIYYTTNGTTPSAVNGTRYTAAFNISSTTTLKAIAIDPAGNASAVATASYTYDVCLSSCQCYAQGCQTCQSSCQISCQTGCQVSCQTGCQVSCQSSCETSCQSGCQVSCQSGCQVSCQTSCQVSCLGCQTAYEIIQD